MAWGLAKIRALGAFLFYERQGSNYYFDYRSHRAARGAHRRQ
jgi:hypothetical protein